jgi:phenylacetaldehyde dehydrogenase
MIFSIMKSARVLANFIGPFLLGDMILKAGIPTGVVNIGNGHGERAGAALATHPDLDKIAFTGSTDVGGRIIVAATGNLKKVSLELGGKSPVLVMSDAELNRTIPGVAMTAFFCRVRIAWRAAGSSSTTVFMIA